MVRTITADMITEYTSSSLRPITLVKFEFDTADLNLWSGVGELEWSGDTYTGAGNLLNISDIEETEAIVAGSVVFTLSGISSTIISTALSEDYQGRTVTIWKGALDSDRAIVADPVFIFSGNMDVMTISESGQSSIVTIIAENQLRALTRPSTRKWTDADQKIIYPSDRGFEELPQIQDEPLKWGR